MLTIIPLDEADEPYRAPDLGWDGERGDLILNALAHPHAPGDFRAEQGLATQVLICLMTDRRVEASELRSGDVNRGWPGDSFDLAAQETALGSRLWLLRRAALVEGVEKLAEDYASEALQPLVDQGAVASFTVTALRLSGRNGLTLDVSLFGRKGDLVYRDKFELLWRQIDGVDRPLTG